MFPSSKSLINCCAAFVASAFVLKPDLRFLPDLKLGCLTSYCHDVDVLFLRFYNCKCCHNYQFLQQDSASVSNEQQDNASQFTEEQQSQAQQPQLTLSEQQRAEELRQNENSNYKILQYRLPYQVH